MPTKINSVDDDTKELLEEMALAAYLDGQCYELAIALNRGLGWDLIGLIQEIDGQTVVRHAAVRHPAGGFFDARGQTAEEQFTRPFGTGQILDFELEEDLRSMTRPIMERSISSAGKLAMSLWPDLQWKKDSYINLMAAFVDDLEKLSRKHGFWLIGNVPNPATWPKVVVEDGDEVGYEVVTVGHGCYAINRALR